MQFEINNQHEKRKTSIEKLQKMMNYQGRFPILVIGDAGTGKTHWINELATEAVEFKNINYIYSGLTEDSVDYWTNQLEKCNQSFLIIEEVEKLSSKSQDILFDALSTTNGLYGFEKKELIIRIIFTTTFPIKKIRDDRRYLSAKFFDRISQFVVEFPNFDMTQAKIFDDFTATWDKIFENDESYKLQCPKSKNTKQWLETEAYRMHGNFRDLDKIVINWNLYQMEGKQEVEILEIIKSEFKHLLNNPSQKIYDDNTFVFIEDANYGDILNDFRMKLKKWALAMHNNDKIKASKMLGVSHRTMERWN
jgi:DNA-binding NtrC family response regulator